MLPERIPETAAAHERIGALVIEDDPDIRGLLIELLEEEGIQTHACANGSEGLALMRAGLRPQVILLDLVMPVMDGWDFRTEQLRDPGLAKIPVILITATGFRAETLQDQLKGVEFIRKPPRASDVMVVVQRVLAKPS